MKSKLHTTHYHVRLNLRSQQVSKKEGATSKTLTVNAGNEPTSNNPKSHASSLKLSSDHEDESLRASQGPGALESFLEGLMMSTLKNDWTTWSTTEALLGKNTLHAHIIDKNIT